MGRVVANGCILGLLLLVGISLAGCDPESNSSSKTATTDLPMRVGTAYWPGQFWVDIAHRKGWFKEAGLNVEVVDTRADYFGSLTDMVAGKLDEQSFALFDLMNFNLAGSDLVMVINADNSNGAEAILANANIQSLKDLRGKHVGVSKGSYLEYILSVVLDREGIDKADVNLFDIQSENAVVEINKESVDAIITYEPFVAEALSQSGIRKLFDSAEIPGISPNGPVFHRKFIDERPGDVQAFVNTWHKTTLYMKSNPRDALAIIAEIYDQTPGDVQAFMQTDKVLDLRENNVAYSFGSGFESLHGVARKINDFLIEDGATDKQMDSTDFIDARFLRTLTENLK
jgi:NitT/TauT family transport system substrate-binding protein